MSEPTRRGKVYLVGAGPGDPGLITLKGKLCIQGADVLIYDYLASPALVDLAQPSTECIYVGKKGGEHTLSQDRINQLIVDKAAAGATVTRLKGGDPFIFGRGGEEAEFLAAHGIEFEIVPGITSAIAAPAYAGIPLTHRDFTSTVAFVTGHENPDKTESGIDWSALAKGVGTLVFLMGVKNLPRIVAQLTRHGRPGTTPVAAVRWGTTTRQATVTGTLENIAAEVQKAGLKAPAVIVVGGVVDLRRKLSWFENRPLWGKRVVVTRARAQASNLVSRLSALGADCLEFPTIKVVPAESSQPLDAAIARLERYDWLIFTSVNGVDFFFERLYALNRDTRALGHVKCAVIGPATAQRLQRFGIISDIVPDNYRAESVAAAFQGIHMQGQRILLPRAAEARRVLPEALGQMGAEVDEIAVYETLPVSAHAPDLTALLESGQVDLVTFTSSSTVKNFRALLPADRVDQLMRGVAVASIGPITTETAQKLGFDVHVTAATYTIDGLCDAIQRFIATWRG